MRKYSAEEHFLDRLYGEYQAYRASVLCCPSDEIFSRCYEIHAMVNLYDIMAEKADGLPESMLTKLLQHRNILTRLYELWIKKEDSGYGELERHVEDEIKNMTKEAEA